MLGVTITNGEQQTSDGYDSSINKMESVMSMWYNHKLPLVKARSHGAIYLFAMAIFKIFSV